ncbi:MAG: Gfo/Idh/MocA family protein [Niabella sp.]
MTGKLNLPKNPRPIVIIGAGGKENDAHLPAYKMAGFKVLGIFDVQKNKAESLKKNFPFVGKVYGSLNELIIDAQTHHAVYDVALPAAFHAQTLEKLPKKSAALMQKPMGNTWEDAKQIVEICKERELTAAVNFQLRYAPHMIAAKEMIEELGDIYDLELMVNVYTPWHLWDFLFDMPRVEILYHSIHYLDLIRSFAGNPERIYASTKQHPKMMDLASTRTTAILDYPGCLQARVITNHGHEFGLKHQASYFKIEGTKGAIKIKIGLSLDYPHGMPSTFEYFLLNEKEKGWQEVAIEGDWFPEAFIGTMAVLQNHLNDPKIPLPHSVEEALETMRLVEAAYNSSESGGTKLSTIK